MQKQNQEYFLLFQYVFQPLLFFFKAGRFLSLPCYPRQLPSIASGNGKHIQPSQERKRRYKGWKQAALYLPFPNVVHKGW